MYTTLLEDDTDTRFESGLPTLTRLPITYPRLSSMRLIENQMAPRRENFTAYVRGITSSSEPFANSTREGYSDYEIKLLNTSGMSGDSDYPTYRLETTDGVMSVIYSSNQSSSSSYLEIDSTGHLILPSLQGQSTGLVPLLVDENGKLVRGTLEDFEQIVSQLRSIHNQSHFTNLTL